ncbi:ABC transporter permease [Nannocystis bainbridge]|uniref:ABC transporter permease subunit n=1 Tax=Nannocystis bainbridge TaxID=2995303 RepID=A0ABT5E5Q4_9BACT|nr:ABC transporter permease subunit [Nannocystis bainbridge]MDC0720740.1 ABC transporter permease subunit [Nannocystis bainbridge]
MSSPALVVFRKELRDTLRDRRTLIAMVVVPLLLFPLLMVGMAKFSQSRAAEARDKTLAVAVADAEAGAGRGSGLADFLRHEPGLEITEVQDVMALPERVRTEELDAAIVIPAGYAAAVAAHQPAPLQLLHKSSDDFDIPRTRLEQTLARFEQKLLEERLRGLGIEPRSIDPLDIQRTDVVSSRELFGKLLGGLLPYMFIIFCFTGGMYPAIDLAAGEKERGTLETLLSSPASRLQITLGKFAVVTLTGFTSALLATVGMYVSVQSVSGIPPAVLAAVQSVLAPGTIALVLALLLPLSVFFAGLLLMLSLYARSYKEAMSIISPLMIVVVVPAAIALAPGVRLGVATALVPVLNVSLATREIIAGTAEPLHLALVFASLLLLAAGSMVACARWFSREDIVFRS